MFKKMLEKHTGEKFDNTHFKSICDIATQDIKFNRIRFNKQTSLLEAIKIAAQCAATLQKCG